MQIDLPAKSKYRVFLNYPFDEAFEQYASAMHFAVTAANLIPVCAKDFGNPDQLRLPLLVSLISECDYSAHDLSRSKPDDRSGFSRMNMPFETGMAMYRSISTGWQAHRCALFVTDPHAYQVFASDLSGLDPKTYSDDNSLVVQVYEWLTTVGPPGVTSRASQSRISTVYRRFNSAMEHVHGGQRNGKLGHRELQELMRRVCEAEKLWNWRTGPLGIAEFEAVPLSVLRASEYWRDCDHELA